MCLRSQKATRPSLDLHLRKSLYPLPKGASVSKSHGILDTLLKTVFLYKADQPSLFVSSDGRLGGWPLRHLAVDRRQAVASTGGHFVGDTEKIANRFGNLETSQLAEGVLQLISTWRVAS